MTKRAPFRPNGTDGLASMRLARPRHWQWIIRIAALTGGLIALPLQAQVSVSAGSTLYTTNNFGSVGDTCAGCHVSPASGSTNHKLASNNPARIVTGLNTAGEMLGTFPAPPNADQRFSLALHIGQIKNPIASDITRATHAGFGRTINLYPLLDATGNGGAPATAGVSAGSASNGTVSAISHVNTSAALFAYNVTYTPNGGHVGSDSFTYTATNASFPTANATNTGTITMITVGVTSAATATFVAGSSGSYSITTNCSTDCALNGANPYSITGTLPSGTVFSTATGLISGTPASTAAGNYLLTIGASTTINGVTRTVTKSLSLTVIGIASAGTANAAQGSAFSYSITTNGTPSGANPYGATGLPAGLSVNSGTGAITGTPVNGGSSSPTISVDTTLGTVSRTLTITTAFAGVPGVSASPASPSGNVNAAYPTVQIVATNPPTASYGAIGLPPGLAVNPTTGAITGTPTQSGTFVATLSATNGPGTNSGTGTTNVTFTVLPVLAPAITAPVSPVAINQGAGVNLAIVATNPPITAYAANGLPPGLSVNPTTGAITGSSSQSGSFNSTLSATNVIGTTNLAVTWNVTPTAVPVIASPTAAAGAIGNAITPISIVASNPPITSYGASGLPSGVSVDPASGVISGTPTVSGSFNVTLTASNSFGPGTLPIVFTVAGITSATTLNATQGQAVAYSITTNGTPSGANPYSATGLPAGLSVNSATGAITGTPTLGGSSNATLGVVTTLGTVSRGLTINTAFAGAPTVSASPTSPVGSVGAAFPAVQISGTNPPISGFGASGLPPGLSVNTSTGAITGTPTQSGNFTANLTATNGAGTGSTPVNFLIVPTSPPAVSNAATVSTPQGSPYADTVIASNPPISAYSATGLPPGLAINPTSGAISGTPTQSGVFNAVLSASNAAGTGTRAVAYTILPTSVPVISSPGALNGTAGTAMSPASITASNPPITAYGGTGLPAGVTVDPATGQITGTPAAPGTYNATLTATNNAGTGQTAVVFLVGALAPVAGNANLAVPLNGTGTLDLATVATGFGITGINVVTPPTKGTLGVSGTVVTYRPNTDYFGPDSFSYIAFGTGGASPAGTVSITVTGRPDPFRTPNVTGLTANQAETSRRFAKAQVTNFQRRLDFLHRPARNAGRGFSAAPAAPAVASPALPAVATASGELRHGDRALAAAWSGVIDQPGRDAARMVPETTSDSLARAASAAAGQAPGSAEAALLQFVQAASRSIDPAMASPAMVAGAIDLAANRRLDLSAVAGNMASPGAGRIGVWAGGSVDFGKRAGSAGQADSSFSTTGISAGADRWVGEDLIVGAGVGYARNESDIGNDGSESIGTGTSFAVYASYQPGDAFFDALLGFVALGYDNSRYASGENAFAKSERSGRQMFATLSAGYGFRSAGITLTPYGRLEFATDRIDGATETGVGISALSYGEQSGKTIAGAVGLRLESTHATNFGWATPRLRLEYRHEAERSDETAIAYADLPGTTFLLGADRRSRNARLFGIGTEFETRAGTRFGIEYLLQDSESVKRGESLMLTFSTVFGEAPVRRSADDVIAKPLGFRVEAGYTYDDNITRSRTDADRLNDQTTSLSVAKGSRFTLTPNTRLWLNGSVAADRSHHFEGLDRVSATGVAEVQYRTSGAFDAPTFALSARASGDEYRSELRDGFRGSIAISMQQAVTDRIGLFAALATGRRSARSAVFDLEDRSARFNLDYALDGGDTVYLGGEFRRGTTFSSGRSSLDDITIAEVIAPDDAYPGRSFFAYRVDARTVIATVGYNLRFGNRDSLDLSLRRIETTPSERPVWSIADESYVAHQLSVFYLTRF